MAEVPLSDDIQERQIETEAARGGCGPFITISRQYGCWGFSLGLLLLDILNEEGETEKPWKIYHKDILDRLARETNRAAEILEKQRLNKPQLIVDFFRSIAGERIPSGYEVRNRITTIIRDLANEGHAIIIGQGGAGATADLPNGISIRLEAPEDWRIRQVAFREQLSETEAGLRIKAREQEREYLRRMYEARFPRKPAFNMVYDCSVFTLAQMAQHVVYAMRLKGMI